MTEPEAKRKIIGRLFIDCFEQAVNLVALYRAMRLRFGYGFESTCDANGPRNVRNTNVAKHRCIFFPPLLLVGKELVLNVQKYASDPRPPHTRQKYEQTSGLNMTSNALKQGKFGSLGVIFLFIFFLVCGGWGCKKNPQKCLNEGNFMLRFV